MITMQSFNDHPTPRPTLGLIVWYGRRFRELVAQQASRSAPDARRVALVKLAVELGALPAEARQQVLEAIQHNRLPAAGPSRAKATVNKHLLSVQLIATGQ